MAEKLRRPRFIAPAAVLLIGLLVYSVFSLFPFSGLTIAWCDMKQQVIPLVIEFRQILTGKADFWLNQQNAGGMSFIGVFFFFLSSPFTLFLAAFSPAVIYKMVNVAVLLKLMTASSTCAYFFEKNYTALDRVQITALSVSYAFCGYTMMYFQNMIWLDTVYLFPVVIHGFFNIVRRRKTATFTAAFSLSLLVHLYLSYMVSLFMILFGFLFTALCVKREGRRRVLFLTARSVLFSFGFTAFSWVPLLYQYFSSARGVRILDNLKGGGILTHWETTVVTLICTAVFLASLFMGFLLHAIRFRRFCAYFILFLLMTAPLVLEPVNKMWHTGSYQAFPSRYGFLTVFTVLLITAEVLYTLNKRPRRIVVRSAGRRYIWISSAVCLVLCANGARLLLRHREELTVYMRHLWFDQQFLFVYLQFFLLIMVALLFFMLLYYHRRLSRRAFSVLFCAVILIESCFSGSVFLGYAGNDITFNEEVLELSGRTEDKDLYRVKQYRKNFDVNIVGSLGYANLGHYTSFTDKDYHDVMKRLGYSSYWMEVSSVGGTVLSDLFLGNRYTIVRSEEAPGKGMPVFYNDLFALLKSNPNAFVAYLTDQQPQESFSSPERMLIQQELMQNLTGITEPLVTRYEPDNLANVTIDHDAVYSLKRTDTGYTGVLYYHIQIEDPETVYFDCFHTVSTRLKEVINGGCNVYVNGEKVEGKYPSQQNNGILTLGTFDHENILVEVELLKNLNASSFGLYGIREKDAALYENALRGVSVKVKQNRLSLSADCEREGEYLVLSVPVHKGYAAYVNGKRTSLQTVYNDFIAVPLSEGHNSVVLRYRPPGVFSGLLISLLTAAALILYLILKKRGVDLRVKWGERVLSISYQVLFCLTVLCVYILPVLIWLLRKKL